MGRRLRLRVLIPVTAVGLLAVFAVVGVLSTRGGAAGDVGLALVERASSGVFSVAGSGEAAAPAQGVDGGTSSKSTADIAAAVPPASALSTHHLLRTGDLSLLVARGRLLSSVDRITSMTQGMGGYVMSSALGSDSPGTPVPLDESRSTLARLPPRARHRDHVATDPYATLTVRVPESDFDAAVKRFAALGEVQSVSTSSEDVTSQYVDLQARLRHYRAVERRLVRFLAATDNVNQMLAVQDRIDEVQMTIEQLSAPAQVAARDHHLRHPVGLPAREGHVSGGGGGSHVHVRRHVHELAQGARPRRSRDRPRLHRPAAVHRRLRWPRSVRLVRGEARAAQPPARGATVPADLSDRTPVAVADAWVESVREAATRRHEETTMKAVRIHEYGGPEVLVYEDVPKPEPGAAQVLVRVEAATVNPVDVSVRENRFPTPKQPPKTIGSDGAGVVEAVGAEVTSVVTGDRVFYSGLGVGSEGSYAEYVVIAEAQAVPIPEGLSFSEAAAIGMAFPAAYYGLVRRGAVQAGETVLVQGAAGGVGSASLQLAKALGATVIATVAGAEEAALVRSLGADDVIDYKTEDVVARALELTGGKGVDLVHEMVVSVNLPADVQAGRDRRPHRVHRSGPLAGGERAHRRGARQGRHAAVHEPQQRQARRSGCHRRRDRHNGGGRQGQACDRRDAAARGGTPRPRAPGRVTPRQDRAGAIAEPRGVSTLCRCRGSLLRAPCAVPAEAEGSPSRGAASRGAAPR